MSHPLVFGYNAALNGDGALPDGDTLTPNGDETQGSRFRSAMEGIGKRLKSLRENDLRGDNTVDALAKRLAELGVRKVSGSTVSRYENGNRMPAADYVAGIATLTGHSVNEILFGPEWVAARQQEMARQADGFQAVTAEVFRVLRFDPTKPGGGEDFQQELRRRGAVVRTGVDDAGESRP